MYTTELADPTPYLEGGELVLTNGLWRRHKTDSQRFVERLASSDVVGLGYGVGARTARVPADLASACHRYSLPLVEVQSRVSFGAIAETVATRQFEERHAAVLDALDRERVLVEASSQGALPILRLLEQWHQERDKPFDAVLLNRFGRVLHTVGRPITPPGAARLEELIRAGRTGQRKGGDQEHALFGIWSGGHHHGFLLSGTRPEDIGHDEHVAIDQSVAFLGLELMRMRAEFVDELEENATATERIMLGGSPTALSARLRARGLALEAGVYGLVIGSPSSAPSELIDVADALNAYFDSRPLIALAGGSREVVAIVPSTAESQDVVGMARDLLAAMQSIASGELHAGVGNCVADVAAVRITLTQARHAYKLADSRGTPIATHADLSSAAALWELLDPSVRHAYAKALLEPVVHYDERRGTQLLRTLRTFLLVSGHWQRAADELHIHVNTVRHRLRTIESLTGKDLCEWESWMDFRLALLSSYTEAEEGSPRLEIPRAPLRSRDDGSEKA